MSLNTQTLETKELHRPTMRIYFPPAIFTLFTDGKDQIHVQEAREEGATSFDIDLVQSIFL